MGNCMNFTSAAASPKSRDKHDREQRRRMMTTPIKTSSDSSVATTAACQTPVSLASTTSPMSQASPGLYDISDEAGSSRSDSADSLDHQRKEGQQRLRDLVVTGAESGDIDWKSIIALAEDLHRKEQLLLRSASSTSSSPAARGGRRMNISRKQAFFERRRKKKDLARRRKMESVGSFSVNLLYYEADEYRSMKGNSNSDKSSTNASASSSHNEKCISNDLAGDEKKNELLERSGSSEDELDVFEDDNDVSSLSSNKTLTKASIQHPVPTTPLSTSKPQFIVEGSFMAATSLFNLPKIDDDDEEECSSSSSSNSSTASETFGRSYDDDGLITIQEDCSVSTWQQQWKQYSR